MVHSIILKDGSEWACEGPRDSKGGYGIFSRRRDGTWEQHTGTSQTPYFKTPAQLSAYVHKNYFTADFDKLPRMVGNDW